MIFHSGRKGKADLFGITLGVMFIIAVVPVIVALNLDAGGYMCLENTTHIYSNDLERCHEVGNTSIQSTATAKMPAGGVILLGVSTLVVILSGIMMIVAGSGLAKRR